MGSVPGNLLRRFVSLASNHDPNKSSRLRLGRIMGIYLVAQALGGYNGYLIADPLVRFEVKGEFGIVPLNYHFGGLLDRLKR